MEGQTLPPAALSTADLAAQLCCTSSAVAMALGTLGPHLAERVAVRDGLKKWAIPAETAVRIVQLVEHGFRISVAIRMVALGPEIGSILADAPGSAAEPERDLDVRIERNANLALWCVAVAGPDELHPAPNHAEAVRRAEALNRYVHRLDTRGDVLAFAYAAPWPLAAEAHAARLAQARPN